MRAWLNIRVETTSRSIPVLWLPHHHAGTKLGECGICHADRIVSLKYTPGQDTFDSVQLKHEAHTARPNAAAVTVDRNIGKDRAGYSANQPLPRTTSQFDLLHIHNEPGDCLHKVSLGSVPF